MKNIKNKKYWKSGSGSTYLGIVVLLICFVASIVIMERFNLFYTQTKAQVIADSVSDGAALAGVNVGGFNSNDMKDMAYDIIDANKVDNASLTYDIQVENEYDKRGVPNGNKLVTVNTEITKKYFVPNYLSYGDRFKVSATAVVRVEAPSTYNAFLYQSFYTNKNMTLPFATSSINHRDDGYVTWFINYYLSPEYNDLYKGRFGNTYTEHFITDYMVCMGFNKTECYQHGHGGWKNYLSSAQASTDGWFKISNLSKAQQYADKGYAVVLVKSESPSLSVVIPKQGNISSNEICIAYADQNNSNCTRVSFSEISNEPYTVYVHY